MFDLASIGGAFAIAKAILGVDGEKEPGLGSKTSKIRNSSRIELFRVAGPFPLNALSR